MDWPLHIWQTKLELKLNISVVRVLHKFLMEISELDSHKCLILIKVLLVAEHLKCQNHMMFACQNVFAFFSLSLFSVCVSFVIQDRQKKIVYKRIEMVVIYYLRKALNLFFHLGRVQSSAHSLENTSGLYIVLLLE